MPCQVAFRGRGKVRGARTEQESSIKGRQGLFCGLRDSKLDAEVLSNQTGSPAERCLQL